MRQGIAVPEQCRLGHLRCMHAYLYVYMYVQACLSMVVYKCFCMRASVKDIWNDGHVREYILVYVYEYFRVCQHMRHLMYMFKSEYFTVAKRFRKNINLTLMKQSYSWQHQWDGHSWLAETSLGLIKVCETRHLLFQPGSASRDPQIIDPKTNLSSWGVPMSTLSGQHHHSCLMGWALRT